MVYLSDEVGLFVDVCVAILGPGAVWVDSRVGAVVGGCGWSWSGGLGRGFPGCWVIVVVQIGTGTEGSDKVLECRLLSRDGGCCFVSWHGDADSVFMGGDRGDWRLAVPSLVLYFGGLQLACCLFGLVLGFFAFGIHVECPYRCAEILCWWVGLPGIPGEG